MIMRRLRFWLRWTLRDLRGRWVQVVATALVIAIGIAVFAGLGGMRGWREDSTRDSFRALAFHDVRVTLAEGGFAREGQLRAALDQLPDDVRVIAAQERLVAPTQIDARGEDGPVFTPGRLIGVPVRDGRERVDEIDTQRGRALGAADDGRAVAIIDRAYANYYGLPDRGRLRLPGGATLDYVGQGTSPEYFLITSETGFGGEATLGVVYAPLTTVQELAGRPGEVNELVLRVAPGTDMAAAKREVQRAVGVALPGVGVDVALGEEEPTSRLLFRDAKNDQRMMTFFGLLVLAGACVAAFNLVSRTVEAGRREVGIGMALGVQPGLLALRPLLLGAQIALLGTVLGALLSAWIANAFADIYRELLPMPAYADPFRPGVFLRGALVGFLLPFGAIVWPVWRSVRVQPIEAIRVGLRSAKGGGLAPLAARVRLPGQVMAQMSLRNILRTPRRTILAVVGLAGVIGALVALLGILDSFQRTIDDSRADLAGRAPDRIEVALDDLHPAGGPVVRGLGAVPGAAAVEPRVDVPTTVRATGGGEEIDVVLSVVDAGSAVWRPTVQEGRFARGVRGVLIPRKLARDLDVGVGDDVVIGRPVLGEGGAIRTEPARVRVAGISGNPFRVTVHLDRSQAAALGLAGVANAASVLPAPGASPDSVQRGLVRREGVATTRPVTADVDALRDSIDEFRDVIQITALAALVLAALMAFNLAGISLEERRREYATMFAFGLPVRVGMRTAVVENLIVGVLGTALGFVVGLLTITWIIHSLMADTWPEIGVVRATSATTVVVTIVVGVVVVALTPLLMTRRVARMDIPSTLRVVE